MINLQRAYNQMETLKEEGLIDSSLDLHFKELECTRLTKLKVDEYEAIYPQYKEEISVDEDGNEVVTEVPIEYIYCEYIPESGGEPIYDEEGNIIGNEPVILEHYEPDNCTLTYTQWLNGWTCPEYDTSIDIANFKATDTKYRTYYKTIRNHKVANIIVTLDNGIRLDGNELAQGRMNNASSVMDDTEVILWMGADNTAVSLTKADLLEAQRKAGEAQTNIWMSNT